MTAALAAISVGIVLGAAGAAADDPPPVGTLGKLDVTTMFAADDPVLTDPAGSASATNDPPHLPPGTKYKLFGTAKDDVDPNNAFNEVISTFSAPLPTQTPDCAPFCATTAGAYKKFGDNVKIAMLTDMLGVKYYFPSRTCSGGSPRIQLGMDRNGDGKFDGNLFGYVGHGGFGSGCVTGTWDYVDLSDNVPFRWDGTQLGCGYQNWPGIVACITTLYPDHRVLNGILVDDSGWSPAAQGCAYYDLVTIGARTLDTHDDTNNNPDAANPC